MNQLNYAQHTNFIAGSQQLGNIHMYLTTAVVPGVNFSLPDAYNQGMKALMPNDGVSFNSLGVEVLCDEDFVIYEHIIKEMQKSKSFTNGSFANRMFDYYTEIYNNKGNLIFTIWFRNCRIENISDINLSSNDPTTLNTFSLSLQYEWFEISHEGLTAEERKKFNIYPKSQLDQLKSKCDCGCDKDCDCECGNGNETKPYSPFV
jgi:hypothetical protein